MKPLVNQTIVTLGILSQLRSYFPQTISTMMDTKIFAAFHKFAVSVSATTPNNLSHLTPEEQTLYDYLVISQKRLEQERITQAYANQILHNCFPHIDYLADYTKNIPQQR